MAEDPAQDLVDAIKALSLTVETLRMAGCDDLAVASALFNIAGGLWREAFKDETERRAVIAHAAEIAITGQPQPWNRMKRDG